MKLISLLLLATCFALCADVHCGPSATGSGNGADWNNQAAFGSLTFVRGNVYYLASGTYSTRTFNTAVSGTTLITVKKATPSDHGTETGWVSSYGTGAATFTAWDVTTSYWTFDGGYGQWASDLPNYAAYGFRILQNSGTSSPAKLIAVGAFGNELTNITFRHVEAGFLNTSTWGKSSDVLWSRADNITLHKCWLHDGGRVIILFTSGMNNLLVEYSVLERSGKGQVAMGWSPDEHSEIVAANSGASNLTIRWSHIRDWQSTGGIILFDNNTGFAFYGNVMTQATYDVTYDANGAVNGLTAGTGSDAEIYNNTFVDINSHPTIMTAGSFTSKITRNNVFYNVRTSSGGAVTIGGTRSHNWFYDSGTQSEANIENGSGDPFVNRAGKDYRLSGATSAGTTLSSPFNVDLLGSTRGADGTWDRGAFEFVDGEAVAPTITTSCPLPGGQVGEAYAQSMSATGTTPITWDLSTGALPDGLSLASGGGLTGTPTTAGTSNFTLRATNATGNDTEACSVVIAAASSPPTTVQGLTLRGVRIQ